MVSQRRDFALPKRRTVLGGMAASVPFLAAAQQGGRGSSSLAYVGTYSSPQGPEGSQGRGKGIYLFSVDSADGSFKQKSLFANDANPSWLAFHPSRKYLYSGNETGSNKGTSSGSVSAYSVDAATGDLRLVNTVSSGGAGPAYISVHPTGSHVFSANYAGGTVAVIPVQADGRLSEPSDIHHDTGTLGSKNAASAPEGSFAISGHDRPHAHMILPDPSGRFVLSTDLGLDQILVWAFDAGTGKLNLKNTVPLPSGDGPRHFVFHPNKRWLYSLQEEGSTLVKFDYEGTTGALHSTQTISSLPKGFTGTNFTSEVVISSDGAFLYAANRLHDSIACFSIGRSGELSFVADEPTRGDYPRSFTLHPSERFLYSCNQRSDHITVFRRDKRTGKLTFTGQYVPVGTPAIILFVS
jgi:6-phosphogluconolactonase